MDQFLQTVDQDQIKIFIEEISSLSMSTLGAIFLILVVMDIITGFVAAKTNGDFISREAWNGVMRQLARTVVYLGVLWINALVNTALITTVLYVFLGAMVISYMVSIKENLKKLNNSSED